MTGSVGSATQSDQTLLGTLLANSATIRQKLDRLSTQASNGLIGVTYAELGTGAPISLNLRPQIGKLQTWQSNVDNATGRMSVTQAAMSQVQSIAASFYAQLTAVGGIDANVVDSIASSARDALGQVAGLLDTQDGGVYVFAGQDTANPPVLDPGNIANMVVHPGGFFAQINAAVAGLGGAGAAVTATATYNVAISNAPGTSPFSTYMSQPSALLQAQLPIVQVGQTATRDIGLLASANALIPDTPFGASPIPGGPPASTGSYMRDVMRALATIGSMTSAQANVAGFQDLVQDTRVSLSGAVNAMASDAGVLGNTQSSLATTRTQLSDTEAALTGQVSSAEDVDMAKTLSQLSLVQTQMQASYQLIAGLSALSLVKYLPVA